MTLLAVFDSKDAPSAFSVTQLHMNLWSLAAFGGKRRSFVLDVGVMIEAGDADVSNLSLGIPFRADEIECLHSKLSESATASLIFNTTATANDAEIVLEEQTLPIHQVSRVGSSRQRDYSSNYFTLWDIELTRPVRAGKVGYFRVRFPVTNVGRAWQWQKQRLFRSGATLDIRVSDGRSAASVPDGKHLIERAVPVDRIAAFVMVPAWMHARTISPSPHYIRLLEGNLWTRYLDRSPEWRSRSRLIVYYWKNEKRDVASGTHEAITPDNPFQIFTDFGIDAHPSRALTVAAASIATIVGLGLVFALPVQPWVLDVKGWIDEAWNDFFSDRWSAGNPISIAAGVTILCIAAWGFARSSFRLANWLRAKFLTAEAIVFRMLSAR